WTALRPQPLSISVASSAAALLQITKISELGWPWPARDQYRADLWFTSLGARTATKDLIPECWPPSTWCPDPCNCPHSLTTRVQAALGLASGCQAPPPPCMLLTFTWLRAMAPSVPEASTAKV